MTRNDHERNNDNATGRTTNTSVVNTSHTTANTTGHITNIGHTSNTSHTTNTGHTGHTNSPTGDTGNGSATDAAWRALPERVRAVWLINEAIRCAIWLAACGGFATVCVLNDWWGFWTQLVAALAAIYAVGDLATQPLQTKYRYAFTRFRIGERDLATRTGWLWRRSTTTPYNRVQHVDTRQNPVQRRFGLTTVVVHTAADTTEIAALDTAEAERMVATVAARVADAREDL